MPLISSAWQFIVRAFFTPVGRLFVRSPLSLSPRTPPILSPSTALVLLRNHLGGTRPHRRLQLGSTGSGFRVTKRRLVFAAEALRASVTPCIHNVRATEKFDQLQRCLRFDGVRGVCGRLPQTGTGRQFHPRELPQLYRLSDLHRLADAVDRPVRENSSGLCATQQDQHSRVRPDHGRGWRKDISS